MSQKNHILNSFKIRHTKFSCCFAHILDQNKFFVLASFYRQFCNVYFPVARTGTGTGTQKRSGLPLQFSEMFRKLSNIEDCSFINDFCALENFYIIFCFRLGVGPPLRDIPYTFRGNCSIKSEVSFEISRNLTEGNKS